MTLEERVAEFERELIIERTNAGLQAAWARGSVSGPRLKLSAEQIEEGQRLLEEKVSIVEVGRRFGVSESTVRRRIRDASNN